MDRRPRPDLSSTLPARRTPRDARLRSARLVEGDRQRRARAHGQRSQSGNAVRSSSVVMATRSTRLRSVMQAWVWSLFGSHASGHAALSHAPRMGMRQSSKAASSILPPARSRRQRQKRSSIQWLMGSATGTVAPQPPTLPGAGPVEHAKSKLTPSTRIVHRRADGLRFIRARTATPLRKDQSTGGSRGAPSRTRHRWPCGTRRRFPKKVLSHGHDRAAA